MTHDCYDNEIPVTLFTRGVPSPRLKCKVCQRDRPVPEEAPEPEPGTVFTVYGELDANWWWDHPPDRVLGCLYAEEVPLDAVSPQTGRPTRAIMHAPLPVPPALVRYIAVSRAPSEVSPGKLARAAVMRFWWRKSATGAAVGVK